MSATSHPFFHTVADAFRASFGRDPEAIIRAPGRVNLMGGHTDYNDGFVLPMAIDRAVWLAVRRVPGRQVQAHSLRFDTAATIALDTLAKGAQDWSKYIEGIAFALHQMDYPLRGWEGVVGGDLPIGSGLSSSAALEMAVARAFAFAAGREWEPRPMARAGQVAENQWVGVNSGIMDQIISAAGVAGHALLIDCRSLDYEAVPLPSGATVAVMDTGTKRDLVNSEYNLRRAECREAAKALGVSALRDASFEQLLAGAESLGPLLTKRARHVVTDIERAQLAAAAMRRDDARRLGDLMNASHASLQYDFEVSTPELDAIVSCAQQHDGGLGARITGAGFGGSAVAVVATEQVSAFLDSVKPCYARQTGQAATFILCQAVGGVELSEV